MTAHRTLWLWAWVWLFNVAGPGGNASFCNLAPCTCYRGKVLCDCSHSSVKELTLERWTTLDYLTTYVSVANCDQVNVAPRAVSDLKVLQKVSVANITNLTMDEQAFSWTTVDPMHPGLTVDISLCTIPEIPSYTFRGSLRDVLLTDVNVSRTRPYAFAAIDHADRLQLTRVRVGEVGPQTFKRFRTQYFQLIDSYFSVFQRRTMVNVEVVKEARFQNIKVNSIESKAIGLHGFQSFKLINSTIGHIGSDALTLCSKGDVSIHDNSLSYLEKGAFLGITLDNMYLRDTGKEDLVFANNTVAQADQGSLAFNTTGFDIRLDSIRLSQPCTCTSIDTWVNDLVLFYHISNLSTVAVELSSIMYCLGPRPSRVIDYRRSNCDVSSSSTPVNTVGLVVGAIAALAALAVVVYCAAQKKGERYITVPPAPSASRIPGNCNRQHMLVVPDGRTYRETELHVIFEHVAPIIPTDYVQGQPDSPV